MLKGNEGENGESETSRAEGRRKRRRRRNRRRKRRRKRVMERRLGPGSARSGMSLQPIGSRRG